MEYQREHPTPVDLNGNPVKRTPSNHPYDYDSFVVWKGEYHAGAGHTVFSDRLFQLDSEKYAQCYAKVWGKASQYFYNRSPKDIEAFLCLYLGQKVKLTAILEGCNASSEYPCWTFIYEED